MKNDYNLSKMYGGILNSQGLTTKSVDDLYHYGQKLIDMGECDKAIECFKKCYELEPKHPEVCFRLFLDCIQNRDYSKALEYLGDIYDINNQHYIADYNYYLYLLSMITELPAEQRQYARSLKLIDIKADLNDYNNTSAPNKIRLSSTKQRFVIALRQHNAMIKQKSELSVQDIIISTLLKQAVKEQKRWKQEINKLVKEKQYEEVIKYLETLKEKRHLALADEYTLILTKELLNIIRTGIIPEKQISSSDKIFDAINGKNYEVALSISLRYLRKNNIEFNSNSMHILLMEIQNLINEKKQSLSSVIKEQAQDAEQQVVAKSSVISLPSPNPLTDILGCLMNNDLDNALIVLRNYLNSIGKTQYEFLILDLIKISQIEGDHAFIKPMVALTCVAMDNHQLNISGYIQEFYDAIAQRKFNIAKIYLDILSKSSILGCPFNLTQTLEQLLHHVETMPNYEQNGEILNRIEQATPNADNNSVSTVSKITSYSSTIKQSPIQPTEQSKNNNYDYQEFINQKLDKVREKGIVLLKPMKPEKRQAIHNIVKNIPDVESFSIGSDRSRRIVLKYSPITYEYINIRETLRLGNKAYKNGDYNACISAYRKLLEARNPEVSVYAKLGLAYMQKFDKKTAINYLTVATELNKGEDLRCDFTERIAVLKGLMPDEDRKIYVKMTVAAFERDIYDCYGIEHVEQVARLFSSGMTIDDACSTVGLDDNQKTIVTLIFARECYAQGNYDLGDQFLKKVERTPNKSRFTKSLFSEITKNKAFYKNRIEEGQKRLVLMSKNRVY